MTTGRPKVLLVDDSKEDRILLAQALADAGFDCQIDEVSDAEEAEQCFIQRMAEDALPHLVILDLILPKRSGLELMERWNAKGFTKLTRIIVLSSVLRESEIAKLRQLGAMRVFEKPLDLDEFLALAKNMKNLTSVSQPNALDLKPETAS